MEPLPNGQHEPAADRGAGGSRASFRAELDSKRYTVVDEDWAGGVPAQYGVPPRVRIGQGKWFNLLWLIPIGLLLLIIGIAVAKGIRELPADRTSCTATPAPRNCQRTHRWDSLHGWAGSTS